jgi:hypothetical protein
MRQVEVLSPICSLSLWEREGVRAAAPRTARVACKAAALTLALSHREREQRGGRYN